MKEVVKKVVQHHLTNGGVSRFEKFKIYHKEFLNIELNDQNLQELSNHFSDLVVDKVIKASYVPGAFEYIKVNHKKYSLYISSATPEDEIVQIAKQRKIFDYFKGVYGSPISKHEHVKRIIKLNNYKENEVIFIGDSTSDRDAANENNIRFISGWPYLLRLYAQAILNRWANDRQILGVRPDGMIFGPILTL